MLHPKINIEGLTPNLLSTIDIPLTPKQAKLYLKKNKLKEKATISPTDIFLVNLSYNTIYLFLSKIIKYSHINHPLFFYSKF